MGMSFKECFVNGCECWDCGPYRIIKQKNADIYNCYKEVEPKKPRKNGGPINQYCSVHKVVTRVETSIDDEGKEINTNVMGAKEYTTLEAAISDCEQDAKVK